MVQVAIRIKNTRSNTAFILYCYIHFKNSKNTRSNFELGRYIYFFLNYSLTVHIYYILFFIQLHNVF